MLVHKPQSRGDNKCVCVYQRSQSFVCQKVKISESFLRVYLETIKTTTFAFMLNSDTMAWNLSDEISSGVKVGRVRTCQHDYELRGIRNQKVKQRVPWMIQTSLHIPLESQLFISCYITHLWQFIFPKSLFSHL